MLRDDNAILAYRNRTPDATLTGGSWQSTLPLSNLRSSQPSKVARSTNLLTSSTQFSVDLTRSHVVRCMALVNHNLSLSAKVRIRLSETDATLATFSYDTGWVDAWPAVYSTYDLDFEAENWFLGTYTEDERAGFQWVLPVILPENVYARYALVEIDDTASATTTYVQLGGFFMGEAWQLTVNMLYGAQLQIETDTEVQKALSGAEYFDRRTPYRVARFRSDFMSEDEGLGRALEIQRRMGVDGEVLFVHNPKDTIHMLRRTIYGRLRQLSPLEYPYLSLTATAGEVKERI